VSISGPTVAGERVVIVGDGETAELAYEYFTHDSPHDVVAFVVERAYRKRDELFGLPVLDFEDMEARFPTADYRAFVAISYTKLNRVRTRLYQEVKRRGYRCLSYVSSRAFVWHNVLLGENCFIFENNVLQYGVRIGDNVVLWSGNHIGHQTVIGDNVFISSHVVVSGYCQVGENCFLGVNSSVADNVKIAKDCLIGMGAVINRDTVERKVYVGSPGRPVKDSFEVYGLETDEG
jgi:sugar O-acyltransferase (sialic acid O-acetyltransferase NeuD family)